MKMTKFLAAASAVAVMLGGSQAFAQSATLNARVTLEIVDTCAFTDSYTSDTHITPAETAEINFGQHLVGDKPADKALELNSGQTQVGAVCASSGDAGSLVVHSSRGTVDSNTSTMLATTGASAGLGTIPYALYRGALGDIGAPFNFATPGAAADGTVIPIPADGVVVPVNIWARANNGDALSQAVGQYEDLLVFAIYQ